jgi:hypothetical protein
MAKNSFQKKIYNSLKIGFFAITFDRIKWLYLFFGPLFSSKDVALASANLLREAPCLLRHLDTVFLMRDFIHL